MEIKKKFLKLYNQMKQKIINNDDVLYKDYWEKMELSNALF